MNTAPAGMGPATEAIPGVSLQQPSPALLFQPPLTGATPHPSVLRAGRPCLLPPLPFFTAPPGEPPRVQCRSRHSGLPSSHF